MVLEVTRQVRPQRRLFTIDEYEQMIDAGVFDEDEHIELIKGEIVKMAAIGLRHEGCVRRLTKLLERRVGDIAIVSVQNSVRLPAASQPEPDVAVLAWDDEYYSERRATPHDVLLLIEVAESSLRYDRTVKVPLYAVAGISEVWVVDLKGSRIEIYSDPVGGQYERVKQVGRGETLQILAGSAATLTVDEVLGNAKV